MKNIIQTIAEFFNPAKKQERLAIELKIKKEEREQKKEKYSLDNKGLPEFTKSLKKSMRNISKTKVLIKPRKWQKCFISSIANIHWSFSVKFRDIIINKNGFRYKSFSDIIEVSTGNLDAHIFVHITEEYLFNDTVADLEKLKEKNKNIIIYCFFPDNFFEEIYSIQQYVIINEIAECYRFESIISNPSQNETDNSMVFWLKRYIKYAIK